MVTFFISKLVKYSELLNYLKTQKNISIAIVFTLKIGTKSIKISFDKNIKSTKSILYILVKSIRLKQDKLHSELLRIQGQIQMAEGRTITMDRVIDDLIKSYRKRKK